MPSARWEIAIGLRCGHCICKWQHCDSSLSLRRLRHPTRKAIRDKERIDRDNTRSQSKHAQEMLSAQTVWNQLRPEARGRDSEMVLGEGGRKKWRESEILSDVTALREAAACVGFLWIHICVGLWLPSVGLRGQNDIYEGHIIKKPNFPWSFEIKQSIVLWKHTVIFRTQNFLPGPKLKLSCTNSLFWNLRPSNVRQTTTKWPSTFTHKVINTCQVPNSSKNGFCE